MHTNPKKSETPTDVNNVLAAVNSLHDALKYCGFTEVGRKSIKGINYSKCWYQEKLNIFAVPFMWRTSYIKFMSRDKKIQNEIYSHTNEMWCKIDIIRNFERLSKHLS